MNSDEDDKRERIGWFQLQLLLQLAFRPKYGYEIINEMKVNEIRISTGQVYPALKKLENSGYLKSFSKKGKAARRKYYSGTIYGAVNAAHRFNRLERERFKDELRRRFGDERTLLIRRLYD